MYRSTLAVTALALCSVGVAACSGRSDCFFGAGPQPLPPSSQAGEADKSVASASSGGASGGTTAYNAGGATPSTAAEATRAISEADIVQLDDEQDRIYAMSRVGALAIVDASRPAELSLMGKISLPGEP